MSLPFEESNAINAKFKKKKPSIMLLLHHNWAIVMVFLIGVNQKSTNRLQMVQNAAVRLQTRNLKQTRHYSSINDLTVAAYWL